MIAEAIKRRGYVSACPIFDIVVNGQTVKARIDTGADLTCVPESIVNLNKILAYPHTIKDHTGKISHVFSHWAEIEFDNRRFTIAVLTRKYDDNLVLIGMDIIKHCHLEMCDGICIFE